jgi:hypothetical protein
MDGARRPSPRALGLLAKTGVSRSGEMPEPTVIVRMEESERAD